MVSDGVLVYGVLSSQVCIYLPATATRSVETLRHLASAEHAQAVQQFIVRWVGPRVKLEAARLCLSAHQVFAVGRMQLCWAPSVCGGLTLAWCRE